MEVPEAARCQMRVSFEIGRLTALATLAHARHRHARESHLHLQQYFVYIMYGLGSYLCRAWGSVCAADGAEQYYVSVDSLSVNVSRTNLLKCCASCWGQ